MSHDPKGKALPACARQIGFQGTNFAAPERPRAHARNRIPLAWIIHHRQFSFVREWRAGDGKDENFELVTTL